MQKHILEGRRELSSHGNAVKLLKGGGEVGVAND